jgi:LPXTG-motif cell wall-anchored protein
LKIFLSLLVIPILVIAGAQAFGQQVTMGVPPEEILKVTIDETGTAHVTHVINSTVAILKPIQVDTISGDLNNLSVTDSNGNPVEYGKMQKTPLSIIINASQRNETLIKYDLVNVVTNTDGVWKWNYYEPQDTDFTAFHFPKGVDVVWANERPVYLGNLGLGQHGNGFRLQYIINEPQTIQTVQLDGRNVAVGIRTVSELGDYVFDKSLLSYSFNVTKADVPVTVIMPQDLLAGPYTVTIDGKPELHQVFHYNTTHAWLGFESDKGGTVQIIGKVVGNGEQTGTIPSGSSDNAVVSGPASTGSSDNTSIYLLIGGIIAAGIAGIIIVKKTRSKTVVKP